MANRETIAKISVLLGAALGHAIPKEALPVWEMVLEPIADDIALQATLEVLREAKACFAVAPGAVYTKALELLEVDYPTEGEAWEMIRAVVRGDMMRAGLPEPVRAAADQIGWATLREWDVTDGATRAHFLQFYRAARLKTVKEGLTALKAPEPSLVLKGRGE